MPLGLRPNSGTIVLGPPGNSPVPLAAAAPPILRSTAAPTTGVNQVETATAATTATSSGNITVTVTSALFATPEVVTLAIVNGDTATVIGGKIRVALAANDNINENFTVGGSTTTASLTTRNAVANDATLNIAIGAGSTGTSSVATSANTTPGVAGTEGILGQEILVYSAGAFSNAYKLVDDDPFTWKVLTFTS